MWSAPRSSSRWTTVAVIAFEAEKMQNGVSVSASSGTEPFGASGPTPCAWPIARPGASRAGGPRVGGGPAGRRGRAGRPAEGRAVHLRRGGRGGDRRVPGGGSVCARGRRGGVAGRAVGGAGGAGGVLAGRVGRP